MIFKVKNKLRNWAAGFAEKLCKHPNIQACSLAKVEYKNKVYKKKEKGKLGSLVRWL